MTTPYQSTYTGAEVDEAVGIALGLGSSIPDPSYSGTQDLGNLEEAGSVTGLGLSFTPTKIQLTVEIPSGGFYMYACPLRGTLTVDGFDYVLSGITNNINYRLHYTLTGDSVTDSSA